MIIFRILSIVALVGAWSAISTPTSAHRDTSTSLLERCPAADGTWQRAACSGDVSGIADLEQAPLVIDDQRFCIIDGVVPYKLVDGIVKWLKASPIVRFGPPAYAVFLESVGAFPCS